ncbi:amino acid adenylation domain-containing protein [Streptomyces collinus]|uniref:amino acid adenylation domain-containing protein n=1 Tax=Streptomyces collinus TaxID=42684 RepID=UPI00367977E2
MTVQLLAPAVQAEAPRFTRGATMHALFQDAARRFPEATALVHGPARVSYRELDAASDTLAALLQEQGVRPGDLVPVLLERGTRLIAVLVALFKCGAAYSVLDPRWPAERLRTQIVQLDAPLLVTASTGAWPVPAWAPPAEDLTVTAARGLRPAPVAVSGGDPCAVFFTSGTSGAPKGVVSLHENAVRLFDEHTFAELGPGTVMPQTAPPTWDGFTLDCWSMLLTGGTTVLLDEPVLVPRALRALIAEDGVNAAFMTTQLFNMLVTTDVGAFAGMRWLAVGGERAAPTRIRRFLAEHPGIRLLNVYGPVECGAIVTAHDIRPEDCDDPAGIPLGRELAHTDVVVLDGDRVCASGETGELCLGGPGLARGYLGRPELTEAVFTTVGGRRVYRTGDLGHRTAGGVLHYTGRGDRQIKVRGHRIEPAEVERTVERVPTVTGAAVVPLPKPDGSYHGLALFYTRADDRGTGPEELRERLASLLPEYLVPRHVHLLDRFPLLANGKLDRRELAARARTEQPAGPGSGGPAPDGTALDGTAGAVAEAFRTVLGTGPVPEHASFFELGGSSLDAARLCQHLDDTLGAAVQLSQLFRTPTVRGLADWLDSAPRAGEPSGTGPEGTPGEVVLPPQQAGFLWAGAHDSTGIGGLCRLTWWLSGPVDLAALELAAGDVQLRHQSLHARYVLREQTALAVLPERPAPAEFLRLPDADDETAAVEHWLAAVFTPLAVDEGRVWRCAALRSRDTGRTLFGLVAHHVAFDGASETVLAADLAFAYVARAEGRAPRFPAPAASLAQVAADHRRALSRADLTAQRAFWEELLDDPEPLRLPGRTGSTRSAGPKHGRSVRLRGEDLARWDARARALGTTRFALLASLFGVVLRELGGQRDILVKVPVARRGSGVLATAVTCRVDLVYLRFRPPGTQDTAAHADALASAVASTDASLAAMELGGAALDHILVWSGGSEALPSIPTFLMQDDPAPVLELPHCTAELLRIDSPVMSTELELDVRLRGSGADVTATVRTDRLPAELADAVVTAYAEAVRRGPAELPADPEDPSCAY